MINTQLKSLKNLIHYAYALFDVESKGEKKLFIEFDEEYMRWKYPLYNYFEGGVSARGIRYKKKEMCPMPELNIIINKIKESAVYKNFLSSLRITNARQQEDIEVKIERFLELLAYRYFRNKTLTKNEINLFLKEVTGKPLKHKLFVYLQGIKLRTKEIVISKNIRIRLPLMRELEEGFKPQDAMIKPHLSQISELPTAVMEITSWKAYSTPIERDIDLFKDIDYVIALFRLFKTCSAKFLLRKIRTDSCIIRGSSEIHSTPHDIRKPVINCIIEKEDNKRIKRFWKIMKALTPNLYSKNTTEKDFEYIAFAYDHLEQALMVPSKIERRLANTVIGLEAIYSDSSTEISRSIRYRMAKLFGLLDVNPETVLYDIKTAYDARSQFLHGNDISKDTLKRIDKKYGSIDNFSKMLLDYLRMSIVIVLYLKQSKHEFLKSIDIALVDSIYDKALIKKLENLKEIIGVVK